MSYPALLLLLFVGHERNASINSSRKLVTTNVSYCCNWSGTDWKARNRRNSMSGPFVLLLLLLLSLSWLVFVRLLLFWCSPPSPRRVVVVVVVIWFPYNNWRPYWIWVIAVKSSCADNTPLNPYRQYIKSSMRCNVTSNHCNSFRTVSAVGMVNKGCNKLLSMYVWLYCSCFTCCINDSIISWMAPKFWLSIKNWLLLFRTCCNNPNSMVSKYALKWSGGTSGNKLNMTLSSSSLFRWRRLWLWWSSIVLLWWLGVDDSDNNNNCWNVNGSVKSNSGWKNRIGIWDTSTIVNDDDGDCGSSLWLLSMVVCDSSDVKLWGSLDDIIVVVVGVARRCWSKVMALCPQVRI